MPQASRCFRPAAIVRGGNTLPCVLLLMFLFVLLARPESAFAQAVPTAGSLDLTFAPDVTGNYILATAVQPDGKIVLAGSFSAVNGQSRKSIVRLHEDGAVDSTATFNSGATAGAFVFSVALQADGKILLGGGFTTVDGQPRNHIARLSNDAATQSLTTPDRTRVHWRRGGSAPEVEMVSFELSTNGGANWNPLGAGTRIPGGWELTGLSLPGSGSLRARGRTSGGANNGSSGLVESVAVFPLPSLNITQANAQVTVSWPFPSTGFVLQHNTDLTSANWTAPTETVTDNATTRSITVTPAPGSRFFRLFRP